MKRSDYRLLSCILVILLAFLCMHFLKGRHEGSNVDIYTDGELIGSYPLSSDMDIELDHNTITIKGGKVYVSSADCPDRLCVRQGAVSHTGDTIACLPNRLLIKISGQESKTTYTALHFDTVVGIDIYNAADPDSVKAALQDLCRQYELICSRTDERSELYKLNHKSISDNIEIDHNGQSLTAYKVSDELYDMISYGLDAYAMSDGLFDITIAPVSDLWMFGSGNNSIPDDVMLKEALKSVCADNIILCPDSYVAFTDDRTMIDLGGLAKGYIADRIRDFLKSKEVNKAIISLGGNVVVMNNDENDAYNIGIKKPFSSSGDIIGTVRSSNGSIVTSGTYERYFKSNGRLYHHILNPSTGYPFETDLSSATVISASSMEGDVLSTILLSEGMQKAVKRADELKKNKIYVILIDDDGNVIYDSGSYILN